MKQLKRCTGPLFLLYVVCLLASACKDDEKTFPTFPAPAWSADSMGFAASMSAVVQLPSNLMPYAQEADQLAAFAGKKCVGKGEKVEGLYYVTIYGTTSEAPPIHFQYYSARNKYMYTSGELFAFEVNKVFGVRDTPEILPLTIAE